MKTKSTLEQFRSGHYLNFILCLLAIKNQRIRCVFGDFCTGYKTTDVVLLPLKFRKQPTRRDWGPLKGVWWLLKIPSRVRDQGVAVRQKKKKIISSLMRGQGKYFFFTKRKQNQAVLVTRPGPIWRVFAGDQAGDGDPPRRHVSELSHTAPCQSLVSVASVLCVNMKNELSGFDHH